MIPKITVFLANITALMAALALFLGSATRLESQPQGKVSSVAVERRSPDGQNYVWIAAGGFRMGCSSGDRECHPDESPAHEVVISTGFWLGQTEVTIDAWKQYRVATGKKALPTRDDLGRRIWNEASSSSDVPVVLIKWTEARDYCVWAGGTLPTEAQWEYAARAGETSQRHGEPRLFGWFSDNSGVTELDTLGISADPERYAVFISQNGLAVHPVATKQPNAWGLYDMLGDVSEWVQDYYGNYRAGALTDPTGPKRGDYRVRRGGSWRGNIHNTRFSTRLEYSNSGDSSAGFRCAIPK